MEGSGNRKSHLLVAVKVILTHDTGNMYVFFLNSNHASMILKQDPTLRELVGCDVRHNV
jgi:hypothetical protein